MTGTSQKRRLAGTMPARRWIRPARSLPFQPSRMQGPAPGRIKLKLFSANPSMSMRKLSPSFNEAASVLAGPGITH